MYVSDRLRKIEYLGKNADGVGILNLPPGGSCVWIMDGLEQESEDGFDVRGKAWRSEGHPVKEIFSAFGHWLILLNDPEGRCFDFDEEKTNFFWDLPKELKWYSEPRALPEDGHFHWFDSSGHDGYQVHCSLQASQEPIPCDIVETVS